MQLNGGMSNNVKRIPGKKKKVSERKVCQEHTGGET